MARHTAKAMRSGKMVTRSSGHSKAAMAHRAGYGAKAANRHTTSAMGRTRPMKASAEIAAITDAKKRRNLSGVPKTKG